MITLILSDGSTKKFNFPSDKEQQFLDMWVAHNNKAVKIKDEEIKLSEIDDCYLGERTENNILYKDFDINTLKNFLGMN